MNYAKRNCDASLSLLSITSDMDETAVNREIGLFWGRLFAAISNAIPEETQEKEIYRILIAAQKNLPAVSQWRIQTGPPPVKEKTSPPYFRLVLLVTAMALVVSIGVISLIKLSLISAVLCLTALLLIGLNIPLTLYRERKRVLPPAIKPRYEWNVDAIRSNLTLRAAGIDADAAALIPKSNARPDAVGLVAELLRQVYQGILPNAQTVMGQIESYLQRHGIEKLDYAPETANLFTVLPADGEKTIAPALVKDGQVLCMGTACIRMDEMNA